MILRPYAIVIGGRLEMGLELLIENGLILELRPHTGIPESFVVSTAFVNAHSHLEYRGLQGRIAETNWWSWIRAITRMKFEENLEEVQRYTSIAASENRKTGVALIGEHSDRPYSGKALKEAGIEGEIFQEVITFFEAESPEEKLKSVDAKADLQRGEFDGPVYLNPHSVYTVDPQALSRFGDSNQPISLHLAESPAESEFTNLGTGPIAEFYREHGVSFQPKGKSVFETARDLGLVRVNSQLVHCCDLSENEATDLAKSGAAVAHCPRSNRALGCPIAPVRDLLDAGVSVGLGMDSPASSGTIDMFSEMKCALGVSSQRHAPLTAEEVWNMATEMGARSLRRTGWRIEAGATVPMIKIHLAGALKTEDLICAATPEMVEWI